MLGWLLIPINQEPAFMDEPVSNIPETRPFVPLYSLPTLSAAQYNPVIKTFYDRLRAAGKPMKVARCAAARKLLHIAFAVVKNEEDFDPLYTAKPRKAA